jgi:hypothetical protein
MLVGRGSGRWITCDGAEGRVRRGWVPSVVKDMFVSPSPWRRMRILSAGPEDGGLISRVREEGKSAFVGRRGASIVLKCPIRKY